MAHSHGADLPPLYSMTDPGHDVTAAFSNLRIKDPKEASPSETTCLAHLKLLESFYLLRETVSSQNGAFGIIQAPNGSPKEPTAAIKEMIREKRWAVFVTSAVFRFHTWWEAVVQPGSKNLQVGHMRITTPTSFFEGWPDGDGEHYHKRRLQLTLPPLDVLMVWHAFMLNPRDYLQDCMRLGKTYLWQTGMPWEAVAQAIDSKTFVYSPSASDKSAWEKATRRPWEQDLKSEHQALQCPECSRYSNVLWTTMFKKEQNYASSALQQGTGYTDSSYDFTCQCGHRSNHETGRVNDFLDDLSALLADNVPMPGTLLSLKGIPGKPDTSSKEYLPLVRWVDYPNVLLSLEIGQKLLNDMKSRISKRDSRSLKMETIRTAIDEALTNQKQREKENKLVGRNTIIPPTHTGRTAIRRMLAAYSDSHGPFTLNLVGAVIRQGNFIKKMHDIDWLHSLNVRQTMSQSVVKYIRFFGIMAQHPKEMAVPTLDVDLVWHTHQLNPRSYYDYSIKTTSSTGKTFIDHDDKVTDSKLSESFAWTSKMYQKTYGELYSYCTCSYCTAIHESSRPSAMSGLPNRFNDAKAADAELVAIYGTDRRSTRAPGKAHISTHNAIAPLVADATGHHQAHQAWLKREARQAERRMQKLGIRHAAINGGSGTTHHAFVATEYPPIYAATPGCANAAADCCSTKCSGGVEADDKDLMSGDASGSGIFKAVGDPQGESSKGGFF